MTQQDNTRRAIVYVDGLNLYYGALKDTPYKWLDLEQLCRRLLPGYAIIGIKYFTSMVLGLHGDADALQRQKLYLRALRTLDLLSIYYGQMKQFKRKRRLVTPSKKSKKWELVYNPEEKQTDVSLAIHLVKDAVQGLCNTAVLITNDSDFSPAIEMVEESTETDVMLVNPDRRGGRNRDLKASEYRQIRKNALANSQFATRMFDKNGEFHKPRSW